MTLGFYEESIVELEAVITEITARLYEYYEIKNITSR